MAPRCLPVLPCATATEQDRTGQVFPSYPAPQRQDRTGQVLLCATATGQDRLLDIAFLRRAGSWILLTLFLSFSYFFLLSSDMGREINCSEVSYPSPYLGICPTSRGKTWIKNREVVFLKKMYALFLLPLARRIQNFPGNPRPPTSTLTMRACPFAPSSPYSVTLKQLSVDYVIIK